MQPDKLKSRKILLRSEIWGFTQTEGRLQGLREFSAPGTCHVAIEHEEITPKCTYPLEAVLSHEGFQTGDKGRAIGWR